MSVPSQDLAEEELQAFGLRVVEDLVRGARLHHLPAVHEDHAVGDLPRNRCLEYQRRDFAATNHIRVQLARACPNCRQYRGKVA